MEAERSWEGTGTVVSVNKIKGRYILTEPQERLVMKKLPTEPFFAIFKIILITYGFTLAQVKALYWHTYIHAPPPHPHPHTPARAHTHTQVRGNSNLKTLFSKDYSLGLFRHV